MLAAGARAGKGETRTGLQEVPALFPETLYNFPVPLSYWRIWQVRLASVGALEEPELQNLY